MWGLSRVELRERGRLDVVGIGEKGCGYFFFWSDMYIMAAMRAEMSEETFEERMTEIGGCSAYVDWKKDCPAVLLVLHEHLGVANYLRVMAQTLCRNELSIVIPSYFPEGETSDAHSHSQDDAHYLKTLNQEVIARRLLDVYRILLTQKK